MRKGLGGRRHQEPASMQSAAVRTNGRQRELTPKVPESWGLDGSKPVLTPASSWAAVRMSLQREEEHESFMLRTAARTNKGSEPSIANKAADSLDP